MDDNRQFDQDWQNENQEDRNGEEQLQRGKFSKLKWKKKQEKKADKIDKGSKKKKQKTKAAIAVVLVAAIAAGGVFTFRSKGKKTQASGSLVMESKVQKGNLSQTVEGTGTLENADSTDLKIPVGLKIKKVKVSEGDEVKKGDTLATVDRTSLLAALAQTQSDLDDVNNQLGDEADSDTSKYVESSVDGRVKKIYASKNTDATDTVLEKGALMLISLDGKMAVKMDTTVSLTVGQEVKVVLSSGSSVTGTVTKSDDESCTITVTDKGTKYNDKVTAYTSSGTKIGTGKLYINKEAKVTATSGTVSSILVSENEYVSEGDNLIKLKGDFQSEEYLSLESEKEDLEEKLASLLKIAKNNTITADSAGIITAINVSEDSESGSASDSSSSSSSSSSSGSSTGNSSLAATGTSANVLAATTKTATNTLMNSSKTANIASASYLSSGNGTSGTTGTIKAVSLSTNQSQATQSNVQSVSEYSADTTENVATITESTNTTDTTENTESSSETTTAKKSDTSSSTTITKSDTAKSDSTSSSTGTNNNQSGSTEKSNSSASTESTKNTTGSQTTNGGSSGNSKNSDGNTGTSGTMNGNGKGGNGISGASGSGAGSTAGVSGNAAGNSASAGTSSDSSSASSSTSSDTNTELTSAFSITAGDEMTLSVNVDEMDILSIEAGQKATVTFDAIENKEYEGEITSIDKNGTTSNGTTKYPVEITLTKEDSMMSGMNASVTITISEVSDALLVPATAVTEEGNTSYVYTEKDSKTGELSGKTEVQTGDTDGTNIVITSGVSEGDTVYYSMAAGGSSDDSSTDNQNNDQNRKDMKMDGSFGGGQGGGNGGGTPPSGGPGGNN
nr:biotin/lipoyl-binding protein [uncultured Anaerobutyricum sp.]